jgi:hypothetical protein
MRAFPFVVGTLLLFALLAFPSTAFACTPPPGGLPRYTVADHVNSAPIVLEGTVTKVTFEPNTPLHAATIEVARYFKGSGPTTITVDGYGPSSLCLSSVEQGAHRIFYVRGNDAGIYRAYYMSQFDATASADSQTIADVIAAVQNITPTVTPTVTPTRSVTATISLAPEAATATARATLLTPNATMTAQRALDCTATSQAKSSTPAPPLFATAIIPFSPRPIATHTPTPASLFEGQRGLEIGALLGLGCLLGSFIGVAVGAGTMALVFGRKND